MDWFHILIKSINVEVLYYQWASNKGFKVLTYQPCLKNGTLTITATFPRTNKLYDIHSIVHEPEDNKTSNELAQLDGIIIPLEFNSLRLSDAYMRQ